MSIATALLALGAYASVAEAVARGYKTNDTALQVGMVVSLDVNDPDKVVRTSPENQTRVVGVVTLAESSSVTVANDNTSVLVESEGEVDVYVSDFNGVVEKGDLLAASPLKVS